MWDMFPLLFMWSGKCHCWLHRQQSGTYSVIFKQEFLDVMYGLGDVCIYSQSLQIWRVWVGYIHLARVPGIYSNADSEDIGKDLRHNQSHLCPSLPGVWGCPSHRTFSQEHLR